MDDGKMMSMGIFRSRSDGRREGRGGFMNVNHSCIHAHTYVLWGRQICIIFVLIYTNSYPLTYHTCRLPNARRTKILYTYGKFQKHHRQHQLYVGKIIIIMFSREAIIDIPGLVLLVLLLLSLPLHRVE